LQVDIEARLAAIEENQREILRLLTKKSISQPAIMGLKQAAAYTGYSADHFRKLAVEQRIVPFIRPSGQQKGKLLFKKSDLDAFLNESKEDKNHRGRPGRRRKSTDIRLW
jgi:hypothetical protein